MSTRTSTKHHAWRIEKNVGGGHKNPFPVDAQFFHSGHRNFDFNPSQSLDEISLIEVNVSSEKEKLSNELSINLLYI